MLVLTKSAINKIENYLDKNEKYRNLPLRIFINGISCSGISYGFTFDKKKETDQLIETPKISIILDSETLNIIKGSTIDYIKDQKGEGFLIKNPNQKLGCASSCEASNCSQCPSC